ncbi:hypothetical protein RCL1_004928 [Eukaryota sp. TZLM3-RCL]
MAAKLYSEEHSKGLNLIKLQELLSQESFNVPLFRQYLDEIVISVLPDCYAKTRRLEYLTYYLSINSGSSINVKELDFNFLNKPESNLSLNSFYSTDTLQLPQLIDSTSPQNSESGLMNQDCQATPTTTTNSVSSEKCSFIITDTL